jgi:hypothetical protein
MDLQTFDLVYPVCIPRNSTSSLQMRLLQHCFLLLYALRAQTITQGVRSLEEDIKGEEDKIRAEQNISAACEIKLLPWETIDEQKSILTADLQEKILGLSAEPMTFIEPPPSDCGFQFALTPHITCATNMLQLDQQLAKVLSAITCRTMCASMCICSCN